MFIHFLFFLLMLHLPPRSTLFPYTTLFRSQITLGRDQIRSACPHRGSPPLPEDSAVNTLFRHESSPRGRRPLDARPLPRRHRPITRAQNSDGRQRRALTPGGLHPAPESLPAATFR